MLLQLRDYLIEKQGANLQELTIHFQQSPIVIRTWLQHWIQKGKVCCEKPTGCGSSCQKCPSAIAEHYKWV